MFHSLDDSFYHLRVQCGGQEHRLGMGAGVQAPLSPARLRQLLSSENGACNTCSLPACVRWARVWAHLARWLVRHALTRAAVAVCQPLTPSLWAYLRDVRGSYILSPPLSLPQCWAYSRCSLSVFCFFSRSLYGAFHAPGNVLST